MNAVRSAIFFMGVLLLPVALAFAHGSLSNSTGGLLNVKDFGCVGDGVHDDTQCMQHAIDTARITKNGVFFPPGM